MRTILLVLAMSSLAYADRVAELRDKPATLVLVDDSEHGHLDVDDVWVWATP